MSKQKEKVIFKNYKSRCDICGAELDANQSMCPYCGHNLVEENEKYRDNEQVILDAFEDIDDAKRRLAHTEKMLHQSGVKKVKSKVVKWILIIIIAQILFFLITGVAFCVSDIHEKEKIDALVNELAGKEVDTIEIKETDITGVEFVDTVYQSAVGKVKESDNLLLIPLYDDDYSNELIVKGNIILDKTGFEKIYNCNTYHNGISFEGYGITVEVNNSPYYDSAIEAACIYDTDFDRLDNIQIGDYVFECYYDCDDDYIFVCELGSGCFIKYEIHYYDDIERSLEDMFKIKYIDIAIE
jgi:hypothetical protein